jgi:membrane protein
MNEEARLRASRAGRLSNLWADLRASVVAWIDDYAPSMGAALAYYTVFSIAPLLLIIIAVAGVVFGEDAVRGQVLAQLQNLMGPEGAGAVEALLKAANHPTKGFVVSMVSVVLLVVGATTVLAELQSALDRIWKVAAVKIDAGVWGALRARVLSLGMILALGFMLLVSLIIGVALAALGAWWEPIFGKWELLLQLVNTAVSLSFSTLLFALIYRYMPRAKIRWRDVWIGAAVTAALFEIGKVAIGTYLGKVGIASAYGAAGSLVVLLIWVYYSAQIFLLGAEFTWVRVSRREQAAPAPGGDRAKYPARNRDPAG